MEAIPRVYESIKATTGVGDMLNASTLLHAVDNAVAWALTLLVLLIVVWLARIPVRDYLGWNRPRAWDVALPVLIVVAIYGALEVAAAIAIQGGDAVKDYRADIARGMSPWWFVLRSWPAFILAPFVEESFYRGFLWRGVESRFGKVSALVVTSLVFVAAHYNYYLRDGVPDLGSLLQYVLWAFFFGWIRWRSGGTTAGIVAHAVSNSAPPIMTVVTAAFVP